MTRTEFGQFIKTVREIKHISQEKIIEHNEENIKVIFPTSTTHRIESGEPTVSIHSIKRLLKALDIPDYFILFIDGFAFTDVYPALSGRLGYLDYMMTLLSSCDLKSEDDVNWLLSVEPDDFMDGGNHMEVRSDKTLDDET